MCAAGFIYCGRPWVWEAGLQNTARGDLIIIARQIDAAQHEANRCSLKMDGLGDAMPWAARLPVNAGGRYAAFRYLGKCLAGYRTSSENLPSSYAEFVERWELPGWLAEGPLVGDVEIGLADNGRPFRLRGGQILSPLLEPYIYVDLSRTGGDTSVLERELSGGDGLWACRVRERSYVYSVGSRMISHAQIVTRVAAVGLVLMGCVGTCAWIVCFGRRGTVGRQVVIVAVVISVIWGIAIAASQCGMDSLPFSGSSVELPLDKYAKAAQSEYRVEVARLANMAKRGESQ